jgi:hypothetical protein
VLGKDAGLDSFHERNLAARSGAASVLASAPEPDRFGEYPSSFVLVFAAKPDRGTIYEILWQEVMGGTANYTHQRLIYVFRDPAGRWQMLGEGPEITNGHSGVGDINYSVKISREAVWMPKTEAGPGVEIRFHIASTKDYFDVSAPGWEQLKDHPQVAKTPPSLTVYRDVVLAGNFPAMPVAISARDYILSAKNETLHTIAAKVSLRFIAWWQDDSEKDRAAKQAALKLWLTELTRLNPKLAECVIAEGTRVELPTPDEEAKLRASMP